MSRNLAAITAGSSNRRFIMLAVALGLLGAILVYVAASRGDSSSGGGLADTAGGVAKQDIPARTTITQSCVQGALAPSPCRRRCGDPRPPRRLRAVTRFPIA